MNKTLKKVEKPKAGLGDGTPVALEAWSDAYDAVSARAFGLIEQIVSSRKAAEEILLEVFLRLANEPQLLSQEGTSVAAWVMLEARSAALRFLRSQPIENRPVNSKAGRNSRSQHGAKSEPQIPESPNFDCLPDLIAIEMVEKRLEILHRAVNELPADQRKALDLALFAGRTEAEIAAEMGEPLGKVQRSLRAAVTFVKHRCRAVCGTWSANI